MGYFTYFIGILDLGTITIFKPITSLLHRTCFNRVLDLSLTPLSELLLSPYRTPLNATQVSLLHLLLPSKLPGRGESFHLDVAPTLCSPPLVPAITSLDVLDLLPRYHLDFVVLRRMPLVSVSLVRFTPLFCPLTAPRYLSAPSGSPF